MYIYKITNKLNGLSYIGQTGDVFERWRQHCARKNRTLGIAIEKDGIENFTFEVIQECQKEELDSLEDEYQAFFHSIDFGYSIK